MNEFNFDSIKIKVPKRDENSHKGDFGRLLVVGGSEGMGGAAILSSEAALYCGAGLINLQTHNTNIQASLERNPEVMCSGIGSDLSMQKIDTLLFGPGLKNDKWAYNTFQNCLKTANFKNVILDAGVLNFFEDFYKKECCKFENLVLTPHPGEAGALLNISAEEVQKDRVSSIKNIAKKYNAHVILKGNGTLIASNDRDGIFICSEGGPELASGGTGDVLAGILSSLITQGMGILDSCILAVAVHSRAGKIFKQDTGEIGLNASSLISISRDLLNE
jgi:NAD(P)H-hydrate epimerase